MLAKRRTKIIATLGPATDDPQKMAKLLKAGVDLVRLNFSHGKAEDHIKRATLVRQLAAELQREVGILADLQGPKIRIARFKSNKVTLQDNQKFVMDALLADDAGDDSQVGIDYKDLPKDVVPGDILLLADGLLTLVVEHVHGSKIMTRVVVGGELSNNKGINRLGGGLSATALTAKDKEDIKTAVAMQADYVAISFPRSAIDVEMARRLVKTAGGFAGIIAKIERTEAVQNIDEIIHAADAVMVARGDLGVELGEAELPGVQKRIIQRARSLDKAVITATQMMESMISSPIPTRAEVFDVANAVLDGTDAVMLSAETATGGHPATVVETMARICLGAEKERVAQVSKHRLECQFQRVDEAIAMAAMYVANHLQIKAIVCLTESGSTPLWMSRIRSGIPIYALTPHQGTRRRVTLYRGVYPIHFDLHNHSKKTVNRAAVETLKSHGEVVDGDIVILTKGDLLGVGGGTNSMKILRVGAVQ